MADTEQKVEETPAAEEPKKSAEEEKPVENGEKTEEAVADGDAKTEEAKDEGGEAKDEAVENHENGKEGEEEEEETPAPSLEAPTENPFTDEDVQQLLDMESGEEGWDKVKEKKGVIVYRKAEKNSSPLIKGVLEYSGIPTEKILEFYTDFEVRRKWNKKTINIEVLDEKDDFKIIHSIFKMPTGCDNRDAVQCTMVRSEEDGSRHVILYKSCNHPSKPPKKSFPIRADVQLMGAIIRPKEGEEGVTTVTFINQVNLKGWMPKAFVNKVTVGFPVALYDDLTLYWKKITEPPKSPEKKEKKNKEKNGEENGDAAEEEKDEEKKEENKEADVETEKKDEGAAAAEGATEGAGEGAPVGEGDGGKLDTADIPAADDEEAK